MRVYAQINNKQMNYYGREVYEYIHVLSHVFQIGQIFR